ncbi:MAG: aminoacetone oxidase family FAD-binding enzyme, partial [Clostridia bacterium]
EVFDLIIENNVCIGAKYKSNGETCTINGDAVILATGGASYPKTGSDGFGYELARRVGHTIVPIKPSLVPLESVEKYCAELMGLSLKNVKISFFEKDKLIYSDMGEMLFTHFGVSGPMILSASAYIKSFPVQMNIDLKPALDERTLENRIINDFLLFKNKVFENSLDKLLPKAMIPVFVRLCGINARKEVNSITKEERREIVKLMKCFPITIKSARPIDEAVITSGGVSVSEINPSSMQSKIAKNLYFAGEIIDVDAYTGGYNLQIAFSTGHLAGKTL